MATAYTRPVRRFPSGPSLDLGRSGWVGIDPGDSGPFSFYTPEGKVRWEAAGSPALRETQSDDVFGPGGLRGMASHLAAGRDDSATPGVLLEARPPRSLNDVSELLAETILPTDIRQAIHGAASGLPAVEALSAVTDQLGRAGHGFAGLDVGGNHREIVFGDDYELLGYQVTLSNPDLDFAPQGALTSWTAYLTRQWTDQLPAGAPQFLSTISSVAGSREKGQRVCCALSVPV